MRPSWPWQSSRTAIWPNDILAIAPSWRRAWNEVIPFLDYPPEVRKLIYTTNAIEALNSKIRRAVRTRGQLPQRRRRGEIDLSGA